MKVLINGTAHEYSSDYPEGWLFSSGDFFKFPVMIGTYPCFIKRFEKKDPASISGWNLMKKLEHIYEPNLVRIYDITSVEEKAKRVYYVFYEYLQGSTLDNVISRNAPIDLTRLTNDLFSALASLQKHGYWFSDFVEKNIFLEESGRFVLMDLDSAQPMANLPDNDMYGSKDYWVLVFAFYKNILHINDLKVADLPGLSLNQLQVIFIILRLNISVDIKKHQYRHTEVFDELPAELDKMVPAAKKVFMRLYDEKEDPQYQDRAADIKTLILQQLVHYKPGVTAVSSPVIMAFSADSHTVEKEGTVRLQWKVNDVSSIELYKNGIFDSRFRADETGVTKTVFYDGGSDTISYKLVVHKDGMQAESNPVEITFKEKVDIPDKSSGKPEPPVIIPRKPIDYYIKMAIIPLLALLLFGVIIRWWPSSGPAKLTLSRIHPLLMTKKEHTVTIYGKNFPVNTNEIRVILNNVPGLIQSHSEDSLTVSYPENVDQSSWRGFITIGVIVNKDTIFTPQRAYVLPQVNVAPQPVNDTFSVPQAESYIDSVTKVESLKHYSDSVRNSINKNKTITGRTP